MTAKPILRVGKIKATGRSTPSSVGAHLARTRKTPNADPRRTDQNRWLVGSADKPLDQMITACMSKAGIDRTRLRKDAVLANDILLSVSPEWFRPDNPEAYGTYDKNRVKSFAAEAEQFLRKQFGPRLVAAVLHLDEATPHVQAVVVPVMAKADGTHRLSSKDYFGPDRLRMLQQAWEDHMRPHGVGPRTKGSRARHTTLREYYSALEASRSTDKRPKITVDEPPRKKIFESTAAYRQRLSEWRRAEAKRLREELRPLAIEASRGRLYDAERRSGIQLRALLAEQGESLAWAYEQIAADKDLIDRLRGTPINAVAVALGYTGGIGKRENAIDLVKRVGEINYKQAVAWLAQRFGSDTAVAAVQGDMPAKVVEVAGEGRVLTKGERIKIDLVGKELTALAAPHNCSMQSGVEPDAEEYLYAIVRADLNMPPGKLAAQAGHAFTDALFVCLDLNPDRAMAYRRGCGGSKVVLSANNESALLRAAAECREAGIPHALVVDHGHVLPPHFDGSRIVTALGLGPVTRAEARKITKRFSCV